MRVAGSLGGLLWCGVFWVFNDCVISLRVASATDVPERAERGVVVGGQAALGGVLTAPVRLLLVSKLSVRLFQFKRDDLVVLK